MLILNDAIRGEIASNIAIGSNGAGTYQNWPAGAYAGTQADAGGGYKVRIRDINNQYPYAESPGTFSITRILRQEIVQKKVATNPHTIHSSGTVTIRFNRYCDLDRGYEISTVPGCDLWWSQNSAPPNQYMLIPCAGAKLKALGVWCAFTYESLHSASGYSDNPIVYPVDPGLPINMVIAYITDQTRCGALRIVSKGDNGSLTISWVTYDY
jgi:hypothetical protein